MTVAQAMEPVLADIQFFTESGGGMTVSGGEPLMQADFTAALLATARAAGIHTAVETSGAGRPQDLEKVARQADLVLYDIKAAPVDYQRLTGADYDRTLGNLRRIKQAGGKLWFRLPLVPGINDTQAHFQNIAKLAAEFQPERVDMVPYHTLGVDKRRRFGMPDAALPDLPSAEKNQVDQWAATLRALGVAVWVPGT
jgi:pyruvate formate lyase activating enzyme